MVDSDNHSENEYNDYGIDSTCEGTYYYIFTFKNNNILSQIFNKKLI